MGVPRRVAGFACRALVVYGALAALLPVLAGTYATCFSAAGNLIFESSVSGGHIHIHPMPDPTAQHDTHIHATNRRTHQTAVLETDSRRPGYLPTAFLVSLVLATPQPWRRKLWAMASGLILINVFIACQLLIVVLCAFCVPGTSLLAPKPPWSTALEAAWEITRGDVVTWFMVPGLIWILVSFRQAYWGTSGQVEARQPAGKTEEGLMSTRRSVRVRRRRRR